MLSRVPDPQARKHARVALCAETSLDLHPIGEVPFWHMLSHGFALILMMMMCGCNRGRCPWWSWWSWCNFAG